MAWGSGTTLPEDTRYEQWDNTATHAHLGISNGHYDHAEQIIMEIPDGHPQKGSLQRRLREVRGW